MADCKKLEAISDEITIDKYSIFIEADKTAKYIYFLKKGICRIYYLQIDREVILGFSFPMESIISLNSYIHNRKGYEAVETLEECTLQRISIQKLQALYQSSVNIANWGRKLAEIEILKIEERLIQKLFLSASERYQNLIKKEPNILQKVKLGHIASYLGVTQVTLSRIRAEIK